MLRLTCPLKRCTAKSSTKSTDDSVDDAAAAAASDLSLILKSTSPSPSPSPSPLKRSIHSVDDATATTLSLSPSPLRRCLNSVATPTIYSSDSDASEYSDSHAFDVFYRPTVTQKLEVVPFLSCSGKTKHLVRSNGDKVGFDAVLGKHLLICCVSLPITSGYSSFRSIITTYSELPRTDFEMVLVPHIKPGFLDGNAIYNRLFSTLPCLAIPFSDSQTCDYICTFLGFSHSSSFEDVSAILVDPSQTLMRCSDVICDFYFTGSEGFPFLKNNPKAVEAQDLVLLNRLDPLSFDHSNKAAKADVMEHPLLREPLSLHKDILLCDPSLVLPLIGHVVDAKQQSLTVSELSNMYVGLYLCAHVDFLHHLIKVHQHCVANKQQFAIVVVCLPLSRTMERLQKKVKRRLERCGITWFILPENKVWRRLWRVFGMGLEQDHFVIIPPNCKNGERDGRVLVENLGVSAYPFTRSAILEQTYTALKSVTPASIFKGTTKKRTCLVHSSGRNVRQSHLKGKKLLVYLDWLELAEPYARLLDLKLCLLLMKNYPKIQAMGWEVVFVPLDVEDKGKRHAMISEMPWPVMPVSNAAETSVTSLLSILWQSQLKHVVAFDEDGRIVSTQVHMILEEEKCGFDNSLFNDVLHKDIVAWLFSLQS